MNTLRAGIAALMDPAERAQGKLNLGIAAHELGTKIDQAARKARDDPANHPSISKDTVSGPSPILDMVNAVQRAVIGVVRALQGSVDRLTNEAALLVDTQRQKVSALSSLARSWPLLTLLQWGMLPAVRPAGGDEDDSADDERARLPQGPTAKSAQRSCIEI